MGKVKISLYCYATVRYSDKHFTEWATKRLDLRKNSKKSSRNSEAIRGIKLKLCRNVHKISLYKTHVLSSPPFEEKRGDIVFSFPWFHGSADLSETLQVYWSWSEDVHVVWI